MTENEQGKPLPSVGQRFVYVTPDYMAGKLMTVRYVDSEYIMWVRDDGSAFVWPLEWWVRDTQFREVE